MATEPRYKKARMIRDFMIEKDLMKMFQEKDEVKTVYFRTAYPMCGENKQVVISIDDTPYLAVQTLLAENVTEEKMGEVLKALNNFNLELPPVKYVLTKDNCVVASMFFVADQDHFNAELIMRVIIEFMKTIGQKHYEVLRETLGQ